MLEREIDIRLSFNDVVNVLQNCVVGHIPPVLLGHSYSIFRRIRASAVVEGFQTGEAFREYRAG